MNHIGDLPRVVVLMVLVGLSGLVQAGLSPSAMGAEPIGEWVGTEGPSHGSGRLRVAPADGTVALFASERAVEIYRPRIGTWATRGTLPALSLTGATWLDSAGSC